MQFTSLVFLFVFLPVMLLVYYLAKETFRPFITIIFSLFFYACGSPAFFSRLCISVLINVALGCGLVELRRKQGSLLLRRVLLTFGVVFDLSVLGYYKYTNFFLMNCNRFFRTSFGYVGIILPLGLSFFTFRAISYLADTYRGEIDEVQPVRAVNYLSFWGQMQSGPITRYASFHRVEPFSRSLFSEGAAQFMVGFSKKVLFADVLNKVTTEIFDRTNTYSTALVWLGAICFSLQLYYDFSGYSDMAMGVSKMLGYGCDKNFRYPYATASVSEFWRRWHISLGAWFRDYVYIPMGGSRVSYPRLLVNLFTVWILTGIWHGAGWNFILWGFMYFMVIAFEKKVKWPERLPNRFTKVLYRIVSLLFIVFQWVLFRNGDLEQGLYCIKTMLLRTSSEIPNARAMFLLRDYFWFLAGAAVLAFPLTEKLKSLCEKKPWSRIGYRVTETVAIIVGFIMALSFVISGQNNPFLYGNF